MRGEYNTRQKRELLSFLKAHSMENFSVDDVVFRLEGEGAKIGRTTAYRYLEALAEQGSVRKYLSAQGITQYQHIEDGEACSGHFHMMCKRCGTLLHVDCKLMNALVDHIEQQHGFLLDPRDTVLAGICRKCQSEEEASAHGADHAEGRHHCL